MEIATIESVVDQKLINIEEYQTLLQQSKCLFRTIADTLDDQGVKTLMMYEDVLSQMAIIENEVHHDIGMQKCSRNVARRCSKCSKSD